LGGGRLNPITEEGLAFDLVASMKGAAASYNRMTGGDAPWTAPESYFRDHAARAIHSRWGVYVSLEEPMWRLREHGRRPVAGRFPRDAKTGRVDLVVWNENDKARAAVEFKRSLSVPGLAADVRRLDNIQYTGLATFGLVAAFDCFKTKDQAEERCRHLRREHALKVVHAEWGRGDDWGEPESRQWIHFVAFRVL